MNGLGWIIGGGSGWKRPGGEYLALNHERGSPYTAVKSRARAAVARYIEGEDIVVGGLQFSQRSETETCQDGQGCNNQHDRCNSFHELLLFSRRAFFRRGA